MSCAAEPGTRDDRSGCNGSGTGPAGDTVGAGTGRLFAMKLKQMLLASALLLAANAGAQAADKFAVVMGNIPSANQFWALVEKGALAKGKEFGIEVTTLG